MGVLPDRPVAVYLIVDRYLSGTRLRLRETTAENGDVNRKLGHKVRLSEGPEQVACTTLYLDDSEWELLGQLPARVLHKTRHIYVRDGITVAVDQLQDGTLLAEIDDGDRPTCQVPDWLDVISEVSADEAWTGAALAR